MIVTPAQMLASVAPRFPAEGFREGDLYGALYAQREPGNVVIKCRETGVERDFSVPTEEYARMTGSEAGIEVAMVSVYWPYGVGLLPAMDVPAADGLPFGAAIRHVLGCAKAAPAGLRGVFDGLRISLTTHFDRETREPLHQGADIAGISWRDAGMDFEGRVAALRRIGHEREAFEQALRPTEALFDGAHPWFAGVGRVEVLMTIRL